VLVFVRLPQVCVHFRAWAGAELGHCGISRLQCGGLYRAVTERDPCRCCAAAYGMGLYHGVPSGVDLRDVQAVQLCCSSKKKKNLASRWRPAYGSQVVDTVSVCVLCVYTYFFILFHVRALYKHLNNISVLTILARSS
jgi:hypothetical protein